MLAIGDLQSWLAAGVSVIALAWAIISGRRANRTAERALAISEAEHRERSRERAVRANLAVSVEPGSNHERDDSGAVWTNGGTIWTSIAITIQNDGDRAAGRTVVNAWIPDAADGDAFWADGPGGAELPDMLGAVRDPAVNLSERAGAPLFPTVRLTRVLDRVSLGPPERLYVRAPLTASGDDSYPIDVTVEAEDAIDIAKCRKIIRIRRRPA